jgi:Ca-activated chloride channel family protein
MELLNPPALWLLGLLIILLLLPRLRRPRVRRAIGNAYMWRSTELSGAPRVVVRVRNSPILQAAVMCLLIAAVARPTALRTERHVAVVLDLSASMSARDGDRTRFDLARDASLAFLRDLPRRSRVRLIGAGTTASDFGEYAARDHALIARLQALRPGAGSAPLDSAISTGRALAGAGAEVHVFTDQPSRPGTAGWVRVGSPADNVAITAMSARRLPGSPLDAQLLVEVRNFGASPREVPITVRHEQALVRHDVVRIGPRESHTFVQNISEPLGVYSATIELQDGLAVDNQRLSILASTSRLRVTLATRAHPFLEAALKANRSLDVRDVPAANLADSEGVVVCEECPEIPEAASGALMIVPPRRGTASVPLRVADALHPVMANVDFGNVGARVESVLESPATGSVLVRGGDVPAIIAFEDKGRRVVVFRLDIDDSNVPLHVAFPVLVANAMNWLGAAAATPVVVSAGEPVRWNTAEDGRVVVTPDGRTIPLRRSGTQSIFADTDVAGVYHVGGHGEPSAFVVNPATDSESDLSDAPPVISVAPPVSMSPSAPAAAPESTRTRTDLFTALVVAGFLVAAADWRRYCRMGRT